MLASVGGVFNAVLVRGDIVGDTLYYGRGAGRLPTASAVLADVADVARRLAAGVRSDLPVFPEGGTPPRLAAVETVEARYYLRLSLLDKPGVLARVAHVLGQHNISIASMIQKEQSRGDYVPVIILTHTAVEKNFQAALAEIDGMDVVSAKTVRLRIEDFA
jgi:homoserine dehydrogenase